MKVLIATDSFKDSLPAAEVCRPIERGIRQCNTNWETEVFPLGDGGEGTARILTRYAGGRLHTVSVADPLMRPVDATFGVSPDGKTAFLDMAECSGLMRLGPHERSPMQTTTYGLGQLLSAAMDLAVEEVVLGIGGSATNEAGMGMAEALGYLFLDDRGQKLAPVGASLNQVRHIVPAAVDPRLSKLRITVLTDVDHPLYGPQGAARVFAPQKGATPDEVEQLDAGLKNMAGLLDALTGTHPSQVKGAGAAGGLGAGAAAFLNATIRPGIEEVMRRTHFSEHLQDAQLVITGEGSIDEQTAGGKVIRGVCREAAKRHIPVIALCGQLNADRQTCLDIGLTAAFSIINSPMDLQQCLQNTEPMLEKAAAHLTGLFG